MKALITPTKAHGPIVGEDGKVYEPGQVFTFDPVKAAMLVDAGKADIVVPDGKPDPVEYEKPRVKKGRKKDADRDRLGSDD